MAQIIEDNIYELESNAATWTLFDELENAFNWQSVTGTDDAKLFTISGNLAIRFDNFETARAAGTSSAKAYIYAVVNGTDIALVQITGNMLTTSRRFKIIIGAAGDLAFQLGNASTDSVPAAGCCLRFAIVNVQSTVDDSVTGYGIYAPKTVGSLGSTITPMDATPLFMYTDDTDTLVPNTGLQGLTNNIRAKITALMPIVCVSSECVSTSAYYPMVSKPDIQQGYVEMEGVLYYCIGGLHFIETSPEGV